MNHNVKAMITIPMIPTIILSKSSKVSSAFPSIAIVANKRTIASAIAAQTAFTTNLADSRIRRLPMTDCSTLECCRVDPVTHETVEAMRWSSGFSLGRLTVVVLESHSQTVAT
jgi:hypothetical protein